MIVHIRCFIFGRFEDETCRLYYDIRDVHVAALFDILYSW